MTQNTTAQPASIAASTSSSSSACEACWATPSVYLIASSSRCSRRVYAAHVASLPLPWPPVGKAWIATAVVCVETRDGVAVVVFAARCAADAPAPLASRATVAAMRDDG